MGAVAANMVINFHNSLANIRRRCLISLKSLPTVSPHVHAAFPTAASTLPDPDTYHTSMYTAAYTEGNITHWKASFPLHFISSCSSGEKEKKIAQGPRKDKKNPVFPSLCLSLHVSTYMHIHTHKPLPQGTNLSKTLGTSFLFFNFYASGHHHASHLFSFFSYSALLSSVMPPSISLSYHVASPPGKKMPSSSSPSFLVCFLAYCFPHSIIHSILGSSKMKHVFVTNLNSPLQKSQVSSQSKLHSAVSRVPYSCKK